MEKVCYIGLNGPILTVKNIFAWDYLYLCIKNNSIEALKMSIDSNDKKFKKKKLNIQRNKIYYAPVLAFLNWRISSNYFF